MAGEIARFDPNEVRAIQEESQRYESARSAAMDVVAERVISEGGYCDELTFSTAFFGGIDPEMNWGSRYTNEALAVDNMPDKFKAALTLTHTLPYAIYEPFVDRCGFELKPIDSIGIIMPGTPGVMEGDVSFEIRKLAPRHYSPRYEGVISFNAFKPSNSALPFLRNSIFTVDRAVRSNETVCAVTDTENFGTISARKHLIGRRSAFNESVLREADSALTELKRDAMNFKLAEMAISQA